MVSDRLAGCVEGPAKVQVTLGPVLPVECLVVAAPVHLNVVDPPRRKQLGILRIVTEATPHGGRGSGGGGFGVHGGKPNLRPRVCT